MSAVRSRSYVWRWDDGSIDRADSLESNDGLYIKGQNGSTHYWLFANRACQTEWVKLWRVNAGMSETEIHLRRETGGWRHADGPLIAGSNGAIDVDIGCTAATNTLPIRRLDLAVGETAEIDVLYLPVTSCAPIIVRQRYARHRGGYDYKNLDTGFSARLTVDAGAWVTEYPGVCRMSKGR